MTTSVLAYMEDFELEVLHHSVAQEIDRRGGHVDSYAAPHVWNLVAKVLREHHDSGPLFSEREIKAQVMVARRQIEDVALAFAKRFSQDEGFDPISWLDKCSSNPELYPLSELWEEEE